MRPAILLLSGGVDSTTVLYQLHREGRAVTCLTFDYGQTLQREVLIAARNAAVVGATFIPMRVPLADLHPACSLFGGSPISRGRTLSEIAAEERPSSYVPFRNGIFLGFAVAFGEARAVEDIYCGGNGLASGNYYDDTTAFAASFTQAARDGTAPSYRPTIHMPLAEMTKAQAVTLALSYGVPLQATYSCYVGDETHCGECDSCRQRIEAFNMNGLTLEGLPCIS